MISNRNPLITLNNKNSFKYKIIIYTALYIVIAIGVFFTLIYFSRTFLRDGEGNIDGISQLYPTYFRLKEIISSLLNGNGFDSWGWYLGLGDDVIMTFQNKLFNPLTYIVILFPEKYLDVGYNLMVIISQYLSGISFMFFLKKMDIGSKQCIVGAISYAFCGWILVSMVRQGPFLIATILLPLIILGVEKILRNESPVLFIIAVALHLLLSTVWAYVAAIVVLIYFAIQYINNYGNNKISDFVKTTFKFICYGLIGIMVSMIALISSFIKLGNANVESTVDIELLYTLRDYLTVPAGFFELSEIHNLYSFITMPAICIIVIPFIFGNLKKRSTAATLALFFS